MKPGVRWAVIVVCVALGLFAAFYNWQVWSGEKAFTRRGCANCHLAGGGPNLSSATSKYSRSELVEFIHDPEVVYKKRGKKPLNYGYVGMHKVKASDTEISNIAAYLHTMAY
jgi:mono/diheme cytochrome c family protein